MLRLDPAPSIEVHQSYSLMQRPRTGVRDRPLHWISLQDPMEADVLGLMPDHRHAPGDWRASRVSRRQYRGLEVR